MPLSTRSRLALVAFTSLAVACSSSGSSGSSSGGAAATSGGASTGSAPGTSGGGSSSGGHAGTSTGGSSGGTNSTGGAGGLSLQAFASNYLADLCRETESCGLLPAYFASGCVSYATSSAAAQNAYLSEELDAGWIAYEPSGAAACLGAVLDAGCTALNQLTFPFDYLSLGGAPDFASCAGMFAARSPQDGGCIDAPDCIDGYCTGSTCPGTCQTYLAQGADCSGGLVLCAPSLTCLIVDGGGEACLPTPTPTTVGLGQSCGDIAGPDGTICDAGYCPYMASPVCTPFVAKGGACAVFTAPVVCAPGTTCVGLFSADAGSCEPLAGPGGACVAIPDGGNGVTGCGLGLACMSGTCATPPSSGSCAPDPNWPCAFGDYCAADGTCKPEDANGTACQSPLYAGTFDPSCFSQFCGLDDVCAPTPLSSTTSCTP